ncbi:MBL fold metallo-hydrolase [Dactylosporangium aurantiacum]|uniref:MBL fold metallo-hydrolase n=1 Tax=Dactylosporangium aurantiacum TaxID=35754 RepID=UPI000693397D|nr:MBL fold metallo-hydrolase [Dactylosporangium aurantiacum]MDG6103126.1 MBL fold metallo-hydrolase [Dactylosporangium aurantiacum]
MRRIVDGVWELRSGYVHAHLIEVDDGLVLVDTGLPRRAGKLALAIRRTGHDLDDLHTILTTHQHPDHIGSLADLRQRTGARVVAHRADVAVITGELPQPVHHWVMRLSAPFLKAAPSPVDHPLDGDGPTGVPGITAVHTPGHTPGHVSFLLDRAGGVLFAGDAASAVFGRVRAAPRAVSADPALALRSAVRLAELDFQVAVFGHGTAVTGDAVSRFRDFAARHR